MERADRRPAERPPIDLSNLPDCVADVAACAAEPDRGAADLESYAALRAAVDAARGRLPALYRRAVVLPFGAALDRLGPAGLRRLLASDPSREGAALVLLDVARAIAQSGADPAVDAFQEVVTDLYDGFLSAEDRRGVKPPDRGVVPPLVEFGRPDFGPYTLPIEAVAALGVEAGVVSLPPATARRGLCLWAALGHETAGHDVLSADTGLEAELAAAIRAALGRAGPAWLAGYWSDRIGETASDVLGILNMGPAAAVGLVATFRGLGAAWGSGPRLRGEGPAEDPHPADLVRAFLAAATVRLLESSSREGWAAAIDAEADRDGGRIVLAGRELGAAEARRSAALVAEVLVRAPLRSLEGHALGAIQGWRDADEEIVARLRAALEGGGDLAGEAGPGTYAAHAVAAAVVAAAAGGAPARLLGRLLLLLGAMHRADPVWSGLDVAHPGDLRRRPATTLRPAPARPLTPRGAPPGPARGPRRSTRRSGPTRGSARRRGR